MMLSDSEFRSRLKSFSVEELYFMFWLIRTDRMAGYYGRMAAVYRDAIFDRIATLKARGTEVDQ